MTELFSHAWTAITLCALALLPCSRSFAVTILGDPIPLSTLTADTTAGVSVGEIRFNNFAYALNGDMPVATAISVIPISDDAGNFGIRLQGDFKDLTTTGPSDADLQYDVSVLNPSKAIFVSHLAGIPVVTGSQSFVSVDLSFSSGDSLEIDAVSSPPHSQTSNSTDVDPSQTPLTGSTDLFALASADGAASVPFLDETFSISFQGIMPGDFNSDNRVNAADYVSYRNGLGSAFTQYDYSVWRSHFGDTAASAASANTNSLAAATTAVPEPNAAFYLLTLLSLGALRRRIGHRSQSALSAHTTN